MNLYNDTMKLIRSKNIKASQISSLEGISQRWASNLVSGYYDDKDPSIHRVQKTHDAIKSGILGKNNI